MASAGFELSISAVKRLQNYVLDRTATGIGRLYYRRGIFGLISLVSLQFALKC